MSKISVLLIVLSSSLFSCASNSSINFGTSEQGRSTREEASYTAYEYSFPDYESGNSVQPVLNHAEDFYCYNRNDFKEVEVDAEQGEYLVYGPLGSVAVFLGKTSDFLSSGQMHGFEKGWYLTVLPEYRAGSLRHLSETGDAHSVEAALYRSVFGVNAHLEWWLFRDSADSDIFNCWSHEVCDVELGAYSLFSEGVDIDGKQYQENHYSWIDGGIPYIPDGMGGAIYGDNGFVWARQWFCRSLAYSFPWETFRPMIECLGALVPQGNGTYESHVALYTQGKRTPSFYDYSIWLSKDGKYLDHITASCDYGSHRDRVNVNFSGYGETHVDIPDSIKESAKEKVA